MRRCLQAMGFVQRIIPIFTACAMLAAPIGYNRRRWRYTMSAPTMTTAETEATITTARAPLRMSYEDWLAWEHEGGLTQWVDGEVIIHMPAKPEHQRVVDFLNRL